MSARGWLAALAAVLIALGFAAYRLGRVPQPPTPQPAAGKPQIDLGKLIDPLGMAKLVATNRSDTPCKLTVVGGDAVQSNVTAYLAARESRMILSVGGLIPVKTATVERAGKSVPHEMNLTITGGETRELVVNADDSVEVVPAGK